MSRKGVAKIINTDKNKVYIISSNNDIVIYLDKVMSDLENGWHKNSKLQQDYFSNPNAFTTKLITTTCKNEIEVNEVRCREIKKYWPDGYNKKCTTSHKGGNTNPFERSGENEDFIMTTYMERLFSILNESNLSQESQDIFMRSIVNGEFTSEYELIRAIRKQEEIERLLEILHKSDLKFKDKLNLENKINNGSITSEYKLETEIESILNTYKTNSRKNKTSRASNKNTSSKRKITQSKAHKKTFQDKIDSKINATEKPTPTPIKWFYNCPKCHNRVSKKDIYCAECGYKLNDKLHPPKTTNSVIAKLFMVEDKTSTFLRYSVSKTFGFVILMLFIIADIIVLLFGIPSTKLPNVALITFGGLFYYALFRLAGIIYRKLSK